MGWKYVMMHSTLQGSNAEVLTPIIFPDKLVHLEVFTVARLLLPDTMITVPYSAGMIEYLYVEGVGGRSDTMNLDSMGKPDEKTINGYKYFHGILR
jgi:hypothetical protein